MSPLSTYALLFAITAITAVVAALVCSAIEVHSTRRRDARSAAAGTYRALPVAGDPHGAWCVVAGDGTVIMEVVDRRDCPPGRHPRQVARRLAARANGLLDVDDPRADPPAWDHAERLGLTAPTEEGDGCDGS